MWSLFKFDPLLSVHAAFWEPIGFVLHILLCLHHGVLAHSLATWDEYRRRS